MLAVLLIVTLWPLAAVGEHLFGLKSLDVGGHGANVLWVVPRANLLICTKATGDRKERWTYWLGPA